MTICSTLGQTPVLLLPLAMVSLSLRRDFRRRDVALMPHSLPLVAVACQIIPKASICGVLDLGKQ